MNKDTNKYTHIHRSTRTHIQKIQGKGRKEKRHSYKQTLNKMVYTNRAITIHTYTHIGTTTHIQAQAIQKSIHTRTHNQTCTITQEQKHSKPNRERD